MTKFAAVRVVDLRFPTGLELDGSDAMNPAPDYSAAYVMVETDSGNVGHGFTFTIGRGNELCVAAAKTLGQMIVGLDVDEVFADMGGLWRRITGDSQLRWVGPDKGVIHLAAAAVINAVWDLLAKTRGLPMWRLLSSMSPTEIADLVDFRYLENVLSRSQAIELLESQYAGRPERVQQLLDDGQPAYSTSAGWLGYSDEKVRCLAETAVAEGWNHLKLKVGLDLESDLRRAAIVRDVIGDDRVLMFDANQVWSVPQAIEHMAALQKFDPWWIEEPTSPDDIIGHVEIANAVSPVKVAAGEMIQNAVMFKQYLQLGGLGICQIDACRVAGVNEVVAVLLLAAQHDVPVCPHAGGVGLCELVQHLSMFDFVAVSGKRDQVVVEFVDHLHEHFVDPVKIDRGRYVAPSAPGYSAEICSASLAAYEFPNGSYWRAAL